MSEAVPVRGWCGGGGGGGCSEREGCVVLAAVTVQLLTGCHYTNDCVVATVQGAVRGTGKGVDGLVVAAVRWWLWCCCSESESVVVWWWLLPSSFINDRLFLNVRGCGGGGGGGGGGGRAECERAL